MKGYVNKGETLICPVCGKEFIVDDDTKYIAGGGYTCSWKCFQKEVKRSEKEDRKKFEERKAKRKKRHIVNIKHRNED